MRLGRTSGKGTTTSRDDWLGIVGELISTTYGTMFVICAKTSSRVGTSVGVVSSISK